MKRIYKPFLLFTLIPCLIGCADNDEPVQPDDLIQMEGVNIQIADRTSDTRATIAGYAVNTNDDPTSNDTSDNARLTGQNGWQLGITVYDAGSQVYQAANGTWAYGSGQWNPTPNPLYLPNYFRPRVEATLYTTDPNAAVAFDQQTNDLLLQQDILVQEADPYLVTPAHVLNLVLRHKHAMLDFVLQQVNDADLASVTVLDGTNTYTPYKVIIAGRTEYLLILPEGVVRPQIRVQTTDGARYLKTLNINPTLRNHCYCITFTGVELQLSSVSVIDWSYGTALAGQYTTPASYPTFRGVPQTTVLLVYDNGLEQTLTFNERGESTVKPYGRTIIRVGDRDLSASPIILNEMYVNLLPYLT